MLRATFRAFNPVLPVFCLVLLAGLPALAAAKEKKPKDPEFLRIYFESPRDTTTRAIEAKVGRSNPMTIKVEKVPILSESHMKIIELVDLGGGSSLRITFNRTGKRLLENYTATGVGRRLVVQTQFEEMRWLAAPRITRRLPDGILVFTPDASPEELERLVRGITKAMKKNLADPDI